MIISLLQKTAFGKIQHTFKIKNTQARDRGEFSPCDKGHVQKIPEPMTLLNVKDHVLLPWDQEGARAATVLPCSALFCFVWEEVQTKIETRKKWGKAYTLKKKKKSQPVFVHRWNTRGRLPTKSML